MKQIPILFKPEMVKAILNDLKTQTRRVINPQPAVSEARYDGTLVDMDEKLYHFLEHTENGDPFEKYYNLGLCPYGNTGDVLWVRETWMRLPRAGFYAYKASHPSFEKGELKNNLLHEYGYRWKPSIHMPKEACRLFLENKNVRVQRISQISDEDCIAEGIEFVGEDLIAGGEMYRGKWYHNYGKYGYTFLSPRDSFISLWQSINGVPKPIQIVIDGKLKTIGYIVFPFNEEYAEPFSGLTKWRGKPLTVATNPWVWVIEFERMKGGVK